MFIFIAILSAVGLFRKDDIRIMNDRTLRSPWTSVLIGILLTYSVLAETLTFFGIERTHLLLTFFALLLILAVSAILLSTKSEVAVPTSGTGAAVRRRDLWVSLGYLALAYPLIFLIAVFSQDAPGADPRLFDLIVVAPVVLYVIGVLLVRITRKSWWYYLPFLFLAAFFVVSLTVGMASILFG